MHGVTATRPNRYRSSRGTVMIEAAIVIPLALFIIAGILDLGHLFQESTIIYQASRAGARTAGAQTGKKTPEGLAFWCNNTPNSPATTLSCADVLGGTPPWGELPGSGTQQIPLMSGFYMACHYLREAGLEPREWDATVQGPFQRTEDTTQMNWLSVSLRRSAVGRRCFFCLQNYLESITIVETSVFPVQCDT